jgi:sRNA-binding regulator protein Hfq
MSNNNHPYWGRAIQNQMKAQAKPQQQSRQEAKPRDNGGFDSLIIGRECFIKLGNGEAVKGVVSAASKFWYLVNIGGQVIVVNKAWVVSVMPTQPQTNKTNNNNGAGDGYGREQPKQK